MELSNVNVIKTVLPHTVVLRSIKRTTFVFSSEALYLLYVLLKQIDLVFRAYSIYKKKEDDCL